MIKINALYLEDPCTGSRMMVDYLAKDSIPISQDQVRNLLQSRDLQAIYQKPRTTIQGDPTAWFPCKVGLRQVKAVNQG